MRFESLLWSALAMFLMGGAAFNDSLAGGASGSGEYQATDGTTPIPPPRP